MHRPMRTIFFAEGAFKKHLGGSVMGMANFLMLMDEFDKYYVIQKMTEVIDFNQNKVVSTPCQKCLNKQLRNNSTLIFKN